MKLSPIAPNQVRYIKLGGGGDWEQECLERNIIRFGFGTASPDKISVCLSRRWDDLVEALIKEGKAKGTATNIANQTRSFFEDDGTTLWITFMKEKLYWAFLDPHPPEPHEDGAGTWRKVAGEWCSTDINGEELRKDNLPGTLTKLAGFRGTSCKVNAAEYIEHRINGLKIQVIERAISAVKDAKKSALDLIKLLGDRDFETLIDLIFAVSGWQRQGNVGRTQKILDFSVVLPTTNERALVQVKSSTTNAELKEYIERFYELESYDKMFYAYHSGSAHTEDQSVIVLGPEQLAELALDAGLVNWLISKAEKFAS